MKAGAEVLMWCALALAYAVALGVLVVCVVIMRRAARWQSTPDNSRRTQ